MTLQEVLLDDGRPFCSHYGAVVGLTELGPEVQKMQIPINTDSFSTLSIPYVHTVVTQNVERTRRLQVKTSDLLCFAMKPLTLLLIPWV